MAKQTPRGLGRGLGALLGDSDIENLRQPVGYVNKTVVSRTQTAKPNSADIVRIPMDMIEPNPYQPRSTFDEEALDELASSIQSLGLIQPITVRPVGHGRYQIISGERRYRACRRASLEEIPAYVLDSSDQGMMEMAIVENVQRADLDPIEVALGYRRLMEECHLTQEAMASRLGLKRASVANILRLLNLSDKIQHDLKVGLVSVGHAKVLLSLDDPALQQKYCDAVLSGGLSVRALEDLIKMQQDKKPSASTLKTGKELPISHKMLEESLTPIFKGGKVKISRNADGSGSITIRFKDDAQIESLLRKIS